jgi:hypothetical protein
MVEALREDRHHDPPRIVSFIVIRVEPVSPLSHPIRLGVLPLSSAMKRVSCSEVEGKEHSGNEERVVVIHSVHECLR